MHIFNMSVTYMQSVKKINGFESQILVHACHFAFLFHLCIIFASRSYLNTLFVKMFSFLVWTYLNLYTKHKLLKLIVLHTRLQVSKTLYVTNFTQVLGNGFLLNVTEVLIIKVSKGAKITCKVMFISFPREMSQTHSSEWTGYVFCVCNWMLCTL